jgi:CMP-N-acetylneuraminic acid synthetase/quercetin dioxygenase-like cupin family protein
MKIVAMIPARLGSKRVKNKNLRLINGKPLIQYIVDAAKGSGFFDEIYLNSESLEFEEIAENSGIKFYQRDEALASDSATNDDFSLDFINSIDCDVLVQLLPTSPFITTKDVDGFVQAMRDGKFETMISVANVQIECVYEGASINFEQKEKTPPSQSLAPIQAYACGLMAWDCSKFRENMIKYGAAYHGGDGKTGYYELKGYSTIDIDNEEDFMIAEAVSVALSRPSSPPKYYSPQKNDQFADADRKRILEEDGVLKNILNEFNQEITSVEKIIDSNGCESSWSHTLVNSPSTCSTLIAQMPGEGNRMHYHPDWDEWWYIIAGKWEWSIEGAVKAVQKGDVVFIERNRKHKITARGDKMAIRLAVSRADVAHIYEIGDI